MFFFIQPCVASVPMRQPIAICSARATSFVRPSLRPSIPGLFAGTSASPSRTFDDVPVSKFVTRSPPSMMADSGGTGPLLKIVAAVMIAGTVITSFLPLISQLRNSVSGTSELVLQEKLSRVPLFTVTDATGRPYLSESDDRISRRGYFFLQPSDAQKYLETVRGTSDDAKLLAISLNDALPFLEMRSSATKATPEQFQLFGDDHETFLANEITAGKFRQSFGPSGVPVFYVDGLAFRNDAGDGTVIPLFFEKKKLDESLANLKKSDAQVTIGDSDLQVVDLMQTIRELRSGSDSRFETVVFVPLTDSLNKLNQMNAGK